MKKNLFMAAVLLLITVPLTTIAQPILQVIKNFGGLNADKAYAVKQLPDNGYIVVGESNSNSGDVSGHHGAVNTIDYLVARFDAAGNVVWQKSYGGSDDDIAVSVDLANDGGFIIAGSSGSHDGDVTDHPNGEVDFEGGAGGGGGQVSSPTYYVHTWVVKIDGAGNINWSKTLPFSIFIDPTVSSFTTRYPTNHPGKIIHTTDGGYLVTLKKEIVPGEPAYPGFSGQESIPYLVKFNSDGSIAWANTYTNLIPEDFGIKALLETAEGYVFVSSPFDFEISGSYDMYLVKVNFSGVIQSSREYGGGSTDVGVSLSATTDGGYIITGSSDSEDGDLTGATHHGGADYWVLKLNSSLDVQWSKLYGGSQDDIAAAVIQLADGNYVIAGSSKSDDQQVTGHTPSPAGQPANSDIWLVKINGGNGNVIWSASYGGDKDETGSDLIKTSDGGMLVAGSSFSSFANIINKGNADWVAVKLYEGCSITPPVCPADQHFCSNTNPTVADLIATGQGIKWYDVPTGSRPLALTKSLNAAGAYYASQTSGSCESARQKVRVRVFVTPGKPAALPQRFLCGSNPKVRNLVAVGQALKWYGSSTSTAVLPASAALHTGTYYVTQTVASLCESERKAVDVTVETCSSRTNVMNKRTGEATDLQDAVIYPNPNKGMFKLFLNTGQVDSKLRITITDIYGRSVWQKDCRAVNGTVQETINAANLAAGMYLVKYTSDGVTNGIKVIIEK